MTSPQKITSNKKNAGKSTGPKTQDGKRTTALNALQHGFYSRELVILEHDKQEFESIRKTLFAQLAPETPLQTIASEQIVSSCWRCKLAIRLEMHRLKPQLTTEKESLSDEPRKERNIREIRWYGASTEDLNRGINILEELCSDIAQNGAIHLKDREDTLIRAFGPQFYDALLNWAPTSIDAIMLSEQLTEHSKLHGLPLPSGPRASASNPSPSTKVVLDQRQKWQMMLKLVEFQLQHLLDIRKMSRQTTPVRQEAHSDFVPRYFASASRDLHRAVDWFLYVKAHAL